MKYTKRILSLVLALTMICAIAISASAANYFDYTDEYTGSTGTCTYHVNGSCTTSRWTTIIEWTYSTDSYKNYTLRSDVAPAIGTSASDFTPLARVTGASATLLAENSHAMSDLYYIEVNYYINGSRVEYYKIYAA